MGAMEVAKAAGADFIVNALLPGLQRAHHPVKVVCIEWMVTCCCCCFHSFRCEHTVKWLPPEVQLSRTTVAIKPVSPSKQGRLYILGYSGFYYENSCLKLFLDFVREGGGGRFVMTTLVSELGSGYQGSCVKDSCPRGSLAYHSRDHHIFSIWLLR